MARFWRGIGKILFWSYSRGSLPYDLMVLAILAFVLLSPRRWFHDQPELTAPPRTGAVMLLAEDPGGNRWTYRVDPSLLMPRQHTPELEREVHQALQESVPELRGRTFEVVQIEPELGSDGTVQAYRVTIRPRR
jgi:hypothetical protein